MNRVRGVLTIVLLCVFVKLGIVLGFLAFAFAGFDAGSGSVFGAVLDGFAVVFAIAALGLLLPAGVALALRPRRPTASSAVATMLGLGVFAVTAQQVAGGGFLLAVNLAGLALILCALPVPERRHEPSGRAPAFDR